MKHFLKWFVLLLRRTCSRPGYLCILLLAPVFGLLLWFTAGSKSGALTITVSSYDTDQEIYQDIVDKLDSRIVSFIICETGEEAIQIVREGRADAAWIFPEDLDEKIHQMITDKPGRVTEDNALVLVYERFDNVFLRLSREILFMRLFPYISYEIYGDFIRTDVGVTEVTEETLRDHYGLKATDGHIIVMESIEGSRDIQEALETSYLLSPVQGLLIVLLITAGFSASILIEKDKRSGLLTWVKRSRLIGTVYAYYLATMLPVAAVIILTLLGVGLAPVLWREILLMIMTVISGAAFCDLIRLGIGRLGGEKALSIMVPIILLFLLAVCPVFLNFRSIRYIQYLLPPFFYLQLATGNVYFWHFLIQMLVYVGLDIVLIRILPVKH
ncbi:MAG: hypothetical protein IJM83_00775 [Firmicutes bacterium]|nr:hypothetical protein [Bacillota bacterium]